MIVRIEKTHFVDADESIGYQYEGDNYRVAFEDVIYICRSYIDNPHNLAFIAREIEGAPQAFDSIPYTENSFQKCLRHFSALGFNSFTLLTDKGYLSVAA